MKTIDTVVEDIYKVLSDGIKIDELALLDFGQRVSRVVGDSLADREDRATLRMSNIGQPCNRKLYYTVNNPEDKEPFPPEVHMKFLFGHVIEELLLFLAEQAGHKVEGRQDEQEISGIKGHRDVILDGVVCDAKSASTYSFNKFKDGKLKQDDPFGYSDQLQSYLYTGQSDPLVTDKSRAAFLVVDKTLGHICLDVHQREETDFPSVYEYKKKVVASDEPPARAFEDIKDGESGNRKLDMNCSYCDFKNKCWPGLRTFLYADKPRFLTVVKREPAAHIPEVGNPERPVKGKVDKEVIWQT